MLEIADFPLLSSSICTLKQSSADTANDEYMTESQIHVVSLDDVCDSYQKPYKLSRHMKSADALCIGNDQSIYIVEFKNGCIDKPEVRSIQMKFLNSLLMLMDITSGHISALKSNLYIILVYNDHKEHYAGCDDNIQQGQSYQFITQSIFGYAKMRCVKFGLSAFLGIYCRDVQTLTCEEFEKIILPNMHSINQQIST